MGEIRQYAEKLFSKLSNNHERKSHSSITGESFLAFASYVLRDESLYPYWTIIDKNNRFKFIEDLLIQRNRYNQFEDYVLSYCGKMWEYVAENMELDIQLFEPMIRINPPTWLHNMIFVLIPDYFSSHYGDLPPEDRKPTICKILSRREFFVFLDKLFDMVNKIVLQSAKNYFIFLDRENNIDEICVYKFYIKNKIKQKLLDEDYILW